MTRKREGHKNEIRWLRNHWGARDKGGRDPLKDCTYNLTMSVWTATFKQRRGTLLIDWLCRGGPNMRLGWQRT